MWSLKTRCSHLLRARPSARPRAHTHSTATSSSPMWWRWYRVYPWIPACGAGNTQHIQINTRTLFNSRACSILENAKLKILFWQFVSDSRDPGRNKHHNVQCRKLIKRCVRLMRKINQSINNYTNTKSRSNDGICRLPSLLPSKIIHKHHFPNLPTDLCPVGLFFQTCSSVFNLPLIISNCSFHRYLLSFFICHSN